MMNERNTNNTQGENNMLTKQFIARTGKGQDVVFWAKITGEGDVETEFDVTLAPVKPHDATPYYFISLPREEAKKRLEVTLPPQTHTVGVILANQKAFEDFQVKARGIKYQKYLEEENSINTMFPGLEELRAAYADQDRYHDQFEKMMEDENNDGINPPSKQKTSPEEVSNQHPAAAAYYKAENYSYSDNVGQFSAGKKALKRLQAGEEYRGVITEMEKEWSDYCQERIWD